jgi:hypothetical protein
MQRAGAKLKNKALGIEIVDAAEPAAGRRTISKACTEFLALCLQ